MQNKTVMMKPKAIMPLISTDKTIDCGTVFAAFLISADTVAFVVSEICTLKERQYQVKSSLTS